MHDAFTNKWPFDHWANEAHLLRPTFSPTFQSMRFHGKWIFAKHVFIQLYIQKKGIPWHKQSVFSLLGQRHAMKGPIVRWYSDGRVSSVDTRQPEREVISFMYSIIYLEFAIFL